MSAGGAAAAARANGAWRSARRAWCCALLSLCWCVGASALSRDGTLRDFRHVAWGPKQGAPSAITALAQTTDGFLWMGNSSGIFRFDGLRFTRFDLPRDPRLSSADVYRLFAPASGGLWIGFTFGGAAFLKDGRMTAYGEREGLPPGSVKAFAQDRDGVVWAGTSSGLARLDGGTWHKVGPNEHYTDIQTEALAVDSAGTLWAASRFKVLSLRRGEQFFQEPPAQPKLLRTTSDVTPGIAESPTGAVWIADAGGLRQVQQNDNPERRTASSGMALLFDRDGSLWSTYGTGSGVGRKTHPELIVQGSAVRSLDGWDLYPQTEGLAPGSGLGAMIEDLEGNVWVAFGTGLDRFSERNVIDVMQREKLARIPEFSGYVAALVAADGGAMWIGGRVFPLFRIQSADPVPQNNVGQVSCAVRADDGTVWFGSRTGLWRYAGGRFDRTALPEGTDEFEVQAIAVDRLGGVWVSIVRRGVFRLADGVWTPYGGIAALPKLTAVTLATDAKGRVWFGYTESRMAVLDGTTVTGYSEREDLAVGNVTAIYAKRGRVWAGGEFGLALLDGDRFRSVIPGAGVALNNVTGVVETPDGDLWVNASAGIVHLAAAETRRVAEHPARPVRGEVFDTLDGVEGSSARLRPLPTAIDGTDGRLWFATNVGIYSIDPARVRRNPVPPQVHIESLTADDHAYAPIAGVKLPQRTTSVRIDYVALSLTMAEKVRYRYKLDGVDKDWQDARDRRQAFYTNLGPGPHRFHVIAANNDGVWNDKGATLDFVIAPTFLQTPWFVALCAVGGALVLWSLMRVRVRQLASGMRARQDARLAERERIARELHDTLLQSTQGLILRFQAVANRISREDPTRELLEKALDRADEVLAEGRDRVLDLRVPIDTLGDLPKAFAASGEDLARGRSVAFSTVVEGQPRELVRTVKDEAYRIGREALLNAFQHSEARAIEVQIIYAADDFRVRVRDDGRGIAAGEAGGKARPGHWGMKGMSERAEKIGAVLKIWTREGAGTEIELRVPAATAYKGRGSLWGWMRIYRIG